MEIGIISTLVLAFMVVILLGICRERTDKKVEKFKVSPAEDVEEGASSLYDWGYHPGASESKHRRHKKHRKHHRRKWAEDMYYEIEPTEYELCRKKHGKKYCYDCDITTNKDIDLYVLKSSVPPCPDMSKYALKSEIPPNIDLSRYILKSKIPPNKCPNISNYIKKSSIPPCPPVPKCPKCPICPVCPDCSYDGLISKADVKKDYIRRDKIHSYCKRIADRLVAKEIREQERARRRRRRRHRRKEREWALDEKDTKGFLSSLFSGFGSAHAKDDESSDETGHYSGSTDSTYIGSTGSGSTTSRQQDIEGTTEANYQTCPNYHRFTYATKPPRPFKPGFTMDRF